MSRRLFSAVKDGLLTADAKTGVVADANRSALKSLGLTIKELQRRKVWELGFKTGMLSSRAAYHRLKHGEKTSDGRFMKLLSKKGQPREIELDCAFFDEDGREVVLLMLHDVTERRRLEGVLQESEGRYSTFFNNSRLGVAVVSLGMRIIKANQSFSRITGYDEDDLAKLTLSDITHPSHLADDRKIMRSAAVCDDTDIHVEKRYISKQGDVIWTDSHLGAVCDPDGKPLYYQLIIEDITERKLIEAELAEKNLRLIDKERTIQKLKDEFIFIAAHELRAPVTAIGWAMEMLQEYQREKGDAKSAEMMLIMDENTKRLKNLVSELLEVSRLEYGTFKLTSDKFSLAAAVAQAVATVRPASEERQITVEVVPAPTNLSQAFGDPLRTHDVIVNLLTNAIKYNHAGGSVAVSVKEVPEDLQISVEDTGFGLEAADIAKLFQRFSRIDTDEAKKVPGTGLGLFIVKQVVERMGGRVWAASPGRGLGSTFSFTLPKAK